MNELFDKLCKLSKSCFIGSVQQTKDIVIDMMKPFADEIKTDITGSVIAKIEGKSDRSILLQAHIDEIGFVVTKVLSGGFVRVQSVGGIDIRTLPSAMITIHAKHDVKGVFTSTPPHLTVKGGDDKFPNFDEIMVDTGLENAEEIISTGDFATFDVEPTKLCGNYFSGKSLDNRTGVLSLIRAAELINNSGKPKDTIYFAFTSGEELGNRGAKIAAFDIMPNEAVAVDVSFGLSPNAPPQHCGICGNGGMIGISPVLSKDVTDRLTDVAKQHNIKYQLEVMGGRTSTDADVISITKSGVKCGLVSVPLRYMHTPIEVVDMNDIESVAQILFEYTKLGTEE